MILQLTDTCAIRTEACTGWYYDETTDTTRFHLINKKILSARGNWCNIIVTAQACGAVATDGTILQYRK